MAGCVDMKRHASSKPCCGVAGMSSSPADLQICRCGWWDREGFEGLQLRAK
eukprot:CAMPEP_0170634298 /NCGR_PEP_ID=MMETSP0224-20130122/36516_1 /TAXON_ID=285029 /ORGANISM="Togula jolla, Strain CCCM 725" /LENGTH=50 /DNA_ID=CAMNT_0010963527 /DNA_START=88 /DNA_END=240 /DNA_ORIENTATION=+